VRVNEGGMDSMEWEVIIYIPPNVEHELVVGDKGCRMIKVFSPPRADFLDGSDSYLRDSKR